MIAETETMNSRPHQDLSQAGYPGRAWQEAKAMAQKKVRWRAMVDALCSQHGDED